MGTACANKEREERKTEKTSDEKKRVKERRNAMRREEGNQKGN
jgi:hypothetical protein